MSAHALGVMALLAALATVGAWYARQPAVQSPRAGSGEAFLPDLGQRLNQVDSVVARTAGGQLLARVERRDGAWRVANRNGYPGDPQTLRATLVGLADARRRAPRTPRPAGWSRLGLQAIDSVQATGVEITLGGLDRNLRVLIGKPAAGDAGGTYVRRVAEGARAWLVDATLDRPDTIADWLDERLLDIAAERIRRVTLQPRDGVPVRVRRDDAGELVLANRPAERQPLSPTIAESIARIVTDLRLRDVHPAASVETPPRLARARFETRSGLIVTLDCLGGASDQSRRYVRLNASTTAAASDSAAERARRLNSRWQGWLYEIPRYKFVNASQTLAGVLASP